MISLPTPLAHAPGLEPFVALLLLFTLGVGAALPPLLLLRPRPPKKYRRRIFLALVLNTIGLAYYLRAAWLFGSLVLWRVGVGSVMLLAVLLFVAVEFAAFLFAHLHRRHREARERAQMPPLPPPPSALDYFHRGYSCAQSVLAPFAPQLELTEEQALRLASGFGAGIGRMRETCGAFCGLTFIAGHCEGNVQGEPAEKEKIFSLVRAEAELFRAEFGSLRCRDLLRLSEAAQEGARPNERSAAYYAARPCERCVAFCESRARQLLSTLAQARD